MEDKYSIHPDNLDRMYRYKVWLEKRMGQLFEEKTNADKYEVKIGKGGKHSAYKEMYAYLTNLEKTQEVKVNELIKDKMSKYEQITTRSNYDKLLSSGMFWEFHPELTGDWTKDEKVINNGQMKKESNVSGNEVLTLNNIENDWGLKKELDLFKKPYYDYKDKGFFVKEESGENWVFIPHEGKLEVKTIHVFNMLYL